MRKLLVIRICFAFFFNSEQFLQGHRAKYLSVFILHILTKIQFFKFKCTRRHQLTLKDENKTQILTTFCYVAGTPKISNECRRLMLVLPFYNIALRAASKFSYGNRHTATQPQNKKLNLDLWTGGLRSVIIHCFLYSSRFKPNILFSCRYNLVRRSL